MKTLFFMIIALFTQIASANEWKHINQNIRGYEIRLSYTTAWSPATYGSEGGLHDGLFYVDIYSRRPMIAESVEIENVAVMKFKEDRSTHFYAKKPFAGSYAEHIWFKKSYKFKIVVDGKILEGQFRL